MEDFTTVRAAIRLFNWMSKDRFRRCGAQPATLQDSGPAAPSRLDGDLRDEYTGTALDTLCDLGFLRRDTGWFKLTDKAERLVKAL